MRTAAACLVALVVAGLASASPTVSQAPSGLYGKVTRGPITPVCQIGIPCDEPAAHATFLLVRNGKSTRVRTDTHGNYRVRLAPGRYVITKPNWGPGGIRPSSARVPPNRFARVNLFIDTGIR